MEAGFNRHCACGQCRSDVTSACGSRLDRLIDRLSRHFRSRICWFRQPFSLPIRTPAAELSSLPFPLRETAAALLVVWVLSGCSEGPAFPSSEDSLSAPEVGVVELQPAALAVIRELPGRIAPTRIAEVRARVSGIVVNRNFEQGSDVKAGDILYELDARPFEIDVDAAEAALRKATAVLNQEKQNAKRMEMLAPSGAAAQSQLDIAIANVGQAEADVAARKADIARAKLNLEYASIRAAISGRIGRALVTEGALVGQSTPTHVATISAARSGLCGLHAIGC